MNHKANLSHKDLLSYIDLSSKDLHSRKVPFSRKDILSLKDLLSRKDLQPGLSLHQEAPFWIWFCSALMFNCPFMLFDLFFFCQSCIRLTASWCTCCLIGKVDIISSYPFYDLVSIIYKLDRNDTWINPSKIILLL